MPYFQSKNRQQTVEKTKKVEIFNPTRVGLFLATYGWEKGGGRFDHAKISDNDAIHLTLGTLIL